MTSTITDQKSGTVSPASVSSSLNGWTPNLVIVESGSLKFLQLSDWFGGTGDEPTDPAVGSYLGTGGWSTDTGGARNIRGADGLAGAGTGDMLAANNLSDVATAATSFSNIKQDASRTATGVIEEATEAEIYAATNGKFIDAGHIETASALIALTDATTVAVDWDTAINFSLPVAGNRTIGNPTNGQPITWRTILVQGNNTTDRTLTFASQYLGDTPSISDCDSGIWYLLTILCITTTHFAVSSKKVKG